MVIYTEIEMQFNFIRPSQWELMEQMYLPQWELMEQMYLPPWELMEQMELLL